MRIYCILIFLATPLLIISQENKFYTKSNSDSKTNIRGNIKNYQDDKNLEFATISLSEFNTDKLVEGTISNKKGKFLFDNLEAGKYKVSISFLGYRDTTIFVTTSKSKPFIKLKNIKIKPNNKLLSEIEISDNKLIYETKIDKIVYNAENDLNDSENDATDVLRKTPLITVDLEDNVTLRGSKNIKFLVNGKASTFFSSDVSTALQMIPADEIKQIEVITSPGAKYDGEGGAGIVNIITKKKRIDGYKASIRSNIGTKTLSFNTNLNIGKNKYGFSVRGGSYGSGFGTREGTDSYTRESWNNDNDTSILTKNGISKSMFNGYRGSISSYYDINTYNTINSSFSFRGRSKPIKINQNSDFISSDFGFIYPNNESIDKIDRTLKMEWTTDYTKSFPDKKGKEFSIAYQLGGDINDGDTEIIKKHLGSAEINTINLNDEKVIEHTLQTDYTLPFGKNNREFSNQTEITKRSKKDFRNKKENANKSKLEVGAKIINRNREIIYSDVSTDDLGYRSDFSGALTYDQIVASNYISTQFALPRKFSIKTGLRYEYTLISGEKIESSKESYENNYYNILPTIVLSKSFSKMKSIKFTYNQRINRPSVREINSNTNKTDNNNITIGNPYLKPSITEQYELTINSFSKSIQGSIQLYHKYSSNVIETYVDSIYNFISYATYKNIGETKQNGISAFGGITLKKISFRTGFNIYNYSGRDLDLGYENWTKPAILYSYNFNLNINISKYWKAESFAFFRSPTQTIQGSSTSFSMMSIGIKKDFKNNRGSLGIRIIEPFSENKVFKTELKGESFKQESIRNIPLRSLAISFKYTIGKLSFKDGSKKSNINNDDIKENNQQDY